METRWNAEHLSPPIEAGWGSRESWPEELLGLTRYVRDRVQARDTSEALRILDQIMADVDNRRRTITELAGQQEPPTPG